jgi:hypothetical protein
VSRGVARRLTTLVLALAALGGSCLPASDRARALHTGDLRAPRSPSWSTYLSGSRGAEIRDIAADGEGNVYVTGGTSSPDFPLTPGAFQTLRHPERPAHRGIVPTDVFVTKMSPSGTILWSTLIGGPNHDRAYAIEVDRRGYVYVAGRAGAGFPVTSGAFQTAFMGGQEATFYGPQDGFVCKLQPDGSALVFCSYFGTPDPRVIRDVVVDERGDLYIASAHSWGAYPAAIQAAFNNHPRGGGDAVLAKIKSDGSAVLWATYVGGSDRESSQNSVRLDAAGHPHLLITTRSKDAPTTPGAFQRALAGGDDLYVGKWTADRGSLVWASYLGGAHEEALETHEFAVDGRGDAYVAVPTRSRDFPTTPGTFRRAYAGGARDVAVAKLSRDGATLLASTFVGGGADDRAEGMAVDASGNVYFTGATSSSDFPVTADAFKKRRSVPGVWDAMAVVVSADLSRLIYSTYLGGGGDDAGRAVTLDVHAGFYVGGRTTSLDWPVLNARPSPSRGARDAFVIAFVPGPARP